MAVECIFNWYWLADLCGKEGIAFVLGHALYLRSNHGGKAKMPSILAHKLGRAAYFMPVRKCAFDLERFLRS